MKKWIAFMLCGILVLAILCLPIGRKIAISYDGNAVLTCDTKKIGMPGEGKQATVTLTAVETKMVKNYLSSAKYEADGAGCPFNENVSIAFGDRVFAIGYDSCGAVRDMTADEDYGLSEEAIAYINSLFEKYAGWYPVR